MCVCVWREDQIAKAIFKCRHESTQRTKKGCNEDRKSWFLNRELHPTPQRCNRNAPHLHLPRFGRTLSPALAWTRHDLTIWANVREQVSQVFTEAQLQDCKSYTAPLRRRGLLPPPSTPAALPRKLSQPLKATVFQTQPEPWLNLHLWKCQSLGWHLLNMGR